MIKNILIIEDEKPNAARLRRMLENLRPQLNIFETLETVSESLHWLQHNECPDVILMDVRLADGTSFEILEKIQIDCPIIFTTAYDEYAVKAFKYNSIDYLLKPIEEEELDKALLKAESSVKETSAASIQNLLQHIAVKEYRSRFLLPYRDGYKSLLISDIEYFSSENKITRAHLLDGKEEILPQTLEELERQLDPKFFFRANRQFIICIEAIRQVHNYFNGKLKIELKKSVAAEIVVSREKAMSLKKWMDF